MDEILVSQEGYDQFFEEIEKLKQQSNNNSILGSQSYVDAVGDGWHDNFSFEETMRESRAIATKLDNMLMDSKKLKIVKENKKSNDKRIVRINDKLKIKVIYSASDEEIYNIILTGKYLPSLDNSELTEITLNSPIGKAIYLKKVGQEVSTKINQNDIRILIIEKFL